MDGCVVIQLPELIFFTEDMNIIKNASSRKGGWNSYGLT